MKQPIVIFFFLAGAFAASAQNDTTRIEQYCQLIATPRLFTNKVTIELDFGEEKAWLIDTRIRNYDGKLKKFNTIIDALNFMGREGWVFINAYSVTLANTTIYHYGFKKLFDKQTHISAAE